MIARSLLVTLLLSSVACELEHNEYCKGPDNCPGDEPATPIPQPSDLPDGCKGENIADQTPHERILNCSKCSADYSFTLAGVDVCGVAEQPAESPSVVTPTPAVVPALDLAKFEAHMKLLDNRAVGYAWGLVDTLATAPKRLAASGANGFATWTPGASPTVGGTGKPMTITTVANVGSATKVHGGVGLLYTFEHLPLTSNPSAINLERFLATPFLYFLPRPAKQLANPSLATVTIGDLLRHRSGIRVETSSTDPAVDLKNLLAEDITAIEHLTRDYNNLNLVAARYLITFLRSPAKREALDQANDLSAEALSAEVDQLTRADYSDYLATTMKQAVGNDFLVTCAADQIDGASWMFDNAASRKSFIYSANQWGGCSTQGGNWTSVDDWAKFFTAYENDKLISAHARAVISNRDSFDAAIGDANKRLIWSRYNGSGGDDGTVSPWMASNHGIGAFFGHLGEHPKVDNGVTYYGRSAVLELPWGYYGVAHVNSSDVTGPELGRQLKDAFAKALGAP